jgi:hypothetical protein
MRTGGVSALKKVHGRILNIMAASSAILPAERVSGDLR